MSSLLHILSDLSITADCLDSVCYFFVSNMQFLLLFTNKAWPVVSRTQWQELWIRSTLRRVVLEVEISAMVFRTSRDEEEAGTFHSFIFFLYVYL